MFEPNADSIHNNRKGSQKAILLRVVFIILALGSTLVVYGNRPTSQILFTSHPSMGNPDIYRINADGSDLRNLTDLAASDVAQVWSPDGRRIAFVSDRDGNFKLFLMDANGDNLRQLPETDHVINSINWGVSGSLAWSPDGRQLVFTCGQPSRESLCVVDVAGGDLRILIENQAQNKTPVWSPDSRQISFSSGHNGHYNIMVMDADGSNPRNLTESVAEDRAPVWSPDGRRIVFVSNRDGNSEIYSIDASGGMPTNLTNNAAADIEPVWSPDGRWIVFVSDRDGDPEIFIMAADGSNPRNLTDNEAWDHSPAWLPDGERIAFASSLDPQFHLYLINTDGGGPRCLTCPTNTRMDRILGSVSRFFGWDDAQTDATRNNYIPEARP